VENNNCSNNVNGIKKFKSLPSCLENYVECEFYDSKSKCNCMKEEIISQFIEIPATKQSIAQRKLIYGVGISDAGYMVRPRFNGKIICCPYYKTWNNMMRRCYSEKLHVGQPAYIGCTAAKEWHIFSNFKKWMEKQDWKGKHLDKDVLIIGNKIYSPDACVFVSRSANNLLTHAKSNKGKYPVGVSFNKKLDEFTASFKIKGKSKHLGVFKTPEQASEVYKAAKSNEIKRVALSQTDIRVREGLLRHAEHLLN